MSSSTPITNSVISSPRAITRRRPAESGVRRAEWHLFLLALSINDVLMVGLAFRVAYWIRFELSLPLFEATALASKGFYEQLVTAIIPLWLLIFAASGLYQRERLLGGAEEYSAVFRGSTFGVLIVVIVEFLSPQFIVARGWVLLAWILTFLLVSLGRLILRRVAYRLRREGFFMSSAVIAGTNKEARMLAQQLMRWATSGLDLVGFVDGKKPTGSLVQGDLRVLGSYEDLDEIIARRGVTEIVLATSDLSREEMLGFFRRYGVSDDVKLRMSSGLYEMITTGLSVEKFAYVPLVGINKVRLTGADRIIKRLLDFALTIPMLIALVPVFLIIALLIRLDSKGPIIYRRRVMGINGREFDAFKFRTMYEDGEDILNANPELSVQLWQAGKLKEDPRVTRVGRWLRRFSFDELPQLFNVLRLEMSLVGPRMISPEEMVKYDEWGINLLTVHPGITGLWQVSGRSDIGYDERVELDMYYVRNWTIWLDLQLLWQTIPAVLRARGAY